MQAVDESISKQITVRPNELPRGENVEFQVTSTRGVSFAESDKTPQITVPLGKPARVQSVTVPRDTIKGANVESFRVTAFGADNKPINSVPAQSSKSPRDDDKKPATVDLTRTLGSNLVSRVVIDIVSTTDNKSPKGVVLDVKACTEITSGQYTTMTAKYHTLVLFFSYRHHCCDNEICLKHEHTRWIYSLVWNNHTRWIYSLVWNNHTRWIYSLVWNNHTRIERHSNHNTCSVHPHNTEAMR
jgi:hypothetical protein